MRVVWGDHMQDEANRRDAAERSAAGRRVESEASSRPTQAKFESLFRILGIRR